MTQKDLNRMMGKPHALLDNVATPGEGEYSIVFNRVDENDEYKNEASGRSAFACGCDTEASGDDSFAANDTTLAQHNASATFGQATKTGRAGQFVCGKYNVETDKALFVVGNGTADNDRNNALEVDADGNVYVDRAFLAGTGNEGSPGSDDQTVVGRYASKIPGPVFIVGGGSAGNSRANVFTVMPRNSGGNCLCGANVKGDSAPTQYNSLTRKDYVDAKFYTLELNETTYDFQTRKLTESAAAALLAAITAKKPIFYIGLCAGDTNMFDPTINDPFCGFVNYNPVPDIDGKYFICIPDYINFISQQNGATFDPVEGEFYPNGA